MERQQNFVAERAGPHRAARGEAVDFETPARRGRGVVVFCAHREWDAPFSGRAGE